MIYSELAQDTINKLITTLQEEADGSELDRAVDEAVCNLVTGFNADQGLLWLIVGDRLTVTSAHSMQEGSLVGLNLDSQKSFCLVLNFLTQGNVAIDLDRRSSDWEPLLKVSQEFDSQLVVALRARDLFAGFLTLQSRKERQWSVDERSTLERFAALLAVIISYEFDLRRLKQSLKEGQNAA